MRLRILPDYGAWKLSDFDVLAAEDLVKKWRAEGLSASTIRNTMVPLRCLFNENRRIVASPFVGLKLPASKGKRERIATPEEAERLIAALPENMRPIWATAFYSGLRLGELQAIRDEDVDLKAGLLHVRDAHGNWDKVVGPVAPKSRASIRSIPIVDVLRPHLLAHQLRRGERGGLFFGSAGTPFNPDTVRNTALRAWKHAKLEPIGFHEARHTFASILIAANVNAKAVQTFMGHSTITVTYDIYGHLMSGAEDEAAKLVNAYLSRMAVGSPHVAPVIT